jgi:hypothetical protein
MGQGMKESDIEGAAIHDGPESCVLAGRRLPREAESGTARARAKR